MIGHPDHDRAEEDGETQHDGRFSSDRSDDWKVPDRRGISSLGLKAGRLKNADDIDRRAVDDRAPSLREELDRSATIGVSYETY